MSAESVASILPGPVVAGTSGASSGATENDAATFLALLAGAANAADAPVTPATDQTPAAITPTAIDGALALQVLPETDCALPPQAALADAASLAQAKPADPPEPQQAQIAQPPAEPAPGTLAEAQPPAATPRVATKDAVKAEEPKAEPKTEAAPLPEPAVTPALPPPESALLALQTIPSAPPAKPTTTAATDEPEVVQATQPGPRNAKAPGKPADALTNDPSTDDRAPDALQTGVKPAAANAQAATADKSAPIANADPVNAQAAPSVDSALAALEASMPRAASAAPATPATRVGHLGPASASVAQEIVRHFDGKSTSFEVRLDPKELGRVDIRIDVAHDKSVTATVSADNPQTLKDLIGSSRDLQRALADAGLNLADNGLSFSDRRETATREFDDSALRGRESQTDDDLPAQITPARPFGVERWGGSRVDMWA